MLQSSHSIDDRGTLAEHAVRVAVDRVIAAAEAIATASSTGTGGTGCRSGSRIGRGSRGEAWRYSRTSAGHDVAASLALRAQLRWLASHGVCVDECVGDSPLSVVARAFVKYVAPSQLPLVGLLPQLERQEND
jgi:hypothetical protein